MPNRIVILGSLNMDLVIRVPRHPLPGETLTGRAYRTFPGGKGANQAVAAARLGKQVTMIGCVGQDAFGDALIANLLANGVDTACVNRLSEATGVALITVNAGGENTIVLAPGANDAVSPEIVAAHRAAIAAADVLLLQLEVPLPAVQIAAEIAHAAHVPIILNPAPARPLPESLLRRITYLIPNQHEAALLAGLPTGTDEEAAAAARALEATGVGTVILTLGERGALVVTGKQQVAVPSFPVQVVDTTAAGDAFVAAFAVALIEDRQPVEAATWGCAAGALACTTPGAQPSLPKRQAVTALVGSRMV